MRSATVVARLILLSVMLALPAAAFAQEAAITGTVTDSTGAVLPGVTVTATNSATGNTFVGVTDDRGNYRVPVRVGTYQITAELQGFATAARNDVQLLVGQNATLSFQLAPSTVQETVTVTGEAPLLDLKGSSLGGNIDPRQVAELPANGRNWIGLALTAPGSRTNAVNAVTPLPDRNGGEAREFQLNVDGQQVSADIGTGGQAKFSADSIAEFQFVANRFDATMGRSTGVQVNAITKSGTNQLAGSFRANFRDDALNAENPVLGFVEPIQNQQYSTTLGGPLVRDKLHYFGNFEYEREPRTSTFNSPYPFFNKTLEGENNQKKGGIRFDYQISSQTRLMGKFSKATIAEPFGVGNTGFTGSTGTTNEYNRETLVGFTQVLNNSTVNEIKVGQAVFGLANQNLTSWSNHWQKPNGITIGSPRIAFTGFAIAPNQNYPRHQDQWVWSARDDFTYSYNKGGRHDLKLGGEFLNRHQIQANCRQCSGDMVARTVVNGASIPNPAQMQAWFPDVFNVDTWNLAAISPWVSTYDIGVGDFNVNLYSKKIASWAQDDWQITDNLTLNLGLRYDLELGVFANDVAVPPFQEAGRPNDTNNIQPRVGFNYRLTDNTGIRGGSGIYYGDAIGADQSFATGNAQIVVIQYANDGRPDFAANPTNGQPLPNYDQAQARLCSGNPGVFNAWKALGYPNPAPCLTRSLQEFVGLPKYVHLPRTFQSSIGVQHQFTQVAAFTVDYVYSKGTDEKDVVDNINLTFNPATGANYPFSNRATRPYPDWGVVSMNTHLGRSSYHALQTSVTKRFSQRWQGAATYTLSGLWNADTKPFSGLEQLTMDTVPDLGGEWGLSADDQRHRMVLNGIWQVGKGFQLSALHFFAAGIRQPHTYGGDVRGTGANFSQRLRPNGTIVPRNDLLAPMQNKTDVRFQQRVPLGGRVALDAIFEVFNAFNRPNWGIGTVESTTTQFLQHTSAQVRTAQFGFRLTF